MHLRRFGSRLLLALGIGFLCPRAPGAQPAIQHDEVGCLPRGEFTELLAKVQPASSIRAVKMYFRSSLYPEFYFVAMSPNDSGAFAAVMPMPTDETTRVVYYFEAVDLAFQTARSVETEALVSGESGCRRGPGAAAFSGGMPEILLGPAQAGAPAIPAGFQAAGITGFLTSTGVVTTSGGIGAVVAVGAAAGAAAGVGVLVTNGGGVSSTTSAPQGAGAGNSSSTSSASTAPTTSVGGGSTSTSSGPTTTSTPATTTSAPASTSISTSTTAPPALTACFTWQAVGNCRVFFDSCSTPESSIARYEWRMLGPPVPEPPQVESFTFSFEADARCRGTMTFNHPVRLTVYDESGRSDSAQQNVTVRSSAASLTDDGATALLSFRSRVIPFAPLEGSLGRMIVNGTQLQPIAGAFPTAYQVAVGRGVVRIEAEVLNEIAPGSLLELDFSASEHIVPGSLRPESGAVVSADQRRIVFRLDGGRGESLRFRLEAR
jgi:hypothetical protein